MGTTVIRRPADVTAIPEVSAPVIQIKENWSDEWASDSGMVLIDASAYTTGHDLGRMQFETRYGEVKLPGATEFTTVERRNILGWWVRLRLIPPKGRGVVGTTVWVGRVSSVVPSPFLSGSEQAGVQTWVAHEALQILRKIHVSESYWDRDGLIQRLHWVPSMNSRDEDGALVGNRSEGIPATSNTVMYGNAFEWSRLDYLLYIIDRFVDESDTGGPTWTIGGQKDVLGLIYDTIQFGPSDTVAAIVRKLIPARMGLDYLIVPTDAGFEIRVFALIADEISFNGSTLPRNPLRMRVATAQYPNLEAATIETKEDHEYAFIRVSGRRIVVCCSLYGANLPELFPLPTTLATKWTASLRSEYEEGAGAAETDQAKHDKFRQHDRYEAVYQMFGAPTDWDFDGGKCNPELNDDGTITTSPVDYQNIVRSTLNWLPLLKGYDYSTWPPLLVNTADIEPGLQKPLVIVRDSETERYVFGDHVLGDIKPSLNDWGVVIAAKPNHLLAKGRTDAFSDKASAEEIAQYDYDNMVATIAFKGDHRLSLTYQLPDAPPSKGILEISVDNAEFWYMSPYTIVGVKPDGRLATSGATARVLRDDTQRMFLIMAGAIARYAIQRAMAVLTFRGLAPYSNLLGHILDVVEFESGQNRIAAPITCVEWTGGDNPTTIVRTGFAQ